MKTIIVPPCVGLVCRIPVDNSRRCKVVVRELSKTTRIKVRTTVPKPKTPRKPSGRVYALQQQCINGHELTEGNLYYPTTRRKRECRRCAIDRVIKYRQRKKQRLQHEQTAISSR